MRDTVFELFETREAAERGVQALLDAGFSEADIGMVGPGAEPERSLGKSLAAGVAGGTVAGGLAGGVLAAAAVGLIPGIGPLLAAGTLLPVLAGTATTAATGGVAGALIAISGHSDEALYYQQQVEAGSWLVSVATDDRSLVSGILAGAGGFGTPDPVDRRREG